MITTSKQDRGSVKTASDLEQKYDLASISTMKVAIENSEDGLNKTNTTLEEFMSATIKSLEDLKNQVDGNITTWFFNGIPTLENAPANEWTTEDDKINHLGDLYYDQDTGYAYRFSMINNAYEWAKITDNDVVEALALANSAQDTADSKRRVFVSTPVPPYDSGDLWFKDSEIYICQISKDKNQIYAEKDFIIATKYTDDTYAKQVGNELKVLSGTVTTIKEGFDSFKVEITTTVDGLDEKLVTAQTSIEANTNEIKLKVDKSGVIGAINLSEEEALIQAKKINLVGAVTISALDSNLNSTITNASTNASNAVSTANNASSNANTALSTANSAKSTADNANTNANKAITTANSANTNASNAVTTANRAISTANGASITASGVGNMLDELTTIEDNVTVIDGGKILTNSITAKQIKIDDLFSLNANIGGWVINKNGLSKSTYISDEEVTVSASIIPPTTSDGLVFAINSTGTIDNAGIYANGGAKFFYVNTGSTTTTNLYCDSAVFYNTLWAQGKSTFSDEVVINRASTDVSGTAAGTPSLIIGNPTGAHIAMDVNEIVCKSNATTPSTLVLQNDGGVLQIGKASTPTTFNIYGSTSFASSVGMNAALTVAGNTTLKSGLELQSATPYIDFHFKSSTADYTSRIIENSSGTLTFYSNIIPNKDITRNLGTSSLRWSNMYTYMLYYTAQSQTSDRRLKTDITDINSKYLELWDMINPQQFTLIGQDKQSIGVIAQEVEESARMVGLTERECGFIHKHLKEDGSDYEYGIDYTFISILNHCKLKVVVDTLNELVKKIEILESKC